MRNLDRWASGCLWVFCGVMTLGLSLPFIIMGALDDDPAARVFGLVTGALMAVVTPLLCLGAAALSLAFNKRPWVLSLVEHMAARYGGATSKPTLLRYAVQPRVVTTISGMEVEIRFLRVGAITGGRLWVVMVMVDAPTPVRVAVTTKRLFINARGALVGLTSFQIGEPALDGAYDFLADDPRRAHALLWSPGLLAMCDALLRFGKGAILNLSPSSKLSLGITYRAGIGPETPPEQVAAVVDQLVALGGRLRGLGGAG